MSFILVTTSSLGWEPTRCKLCCVSALTDAPVLTLQVRGTLLTASQCATYDDTKRLWMSATGWRDGLGTHVGVSMITGLSPGRCTLKCICPR